MSLKMTRWTFRASVAAGIWLMFWAATQLAYAQASDTDRRLGALEAMRADARLATVEARFDALDKRLDKLESLGLGIVGAVGMQLLVSALSLRKPR